MTPIRYITSDAETLAAAQHEAERMRELGVLPPLDSPAVAAAKPDEDESGCEGHPAGEFDPMGETFYCDGSCNPNRSKRS